MNSYKAHSIVSQINPLLDDQCAQIFFDVMFSSRHFLSDAIQPECIDNMLMEPRIAASLLQP
jgi:hypothetical protein